MLWASPAQELGNALSRYNSLTNSVGLDIINEVVTCDLFSGHSYCHVPEVTSKFKKILSETYGTKSNLDTERDRSAEVYLQHTILFGFLYNPSLNPQMSRQGASRSMGKNSHIALTPLGRACRAAEHQTPGDGYKKFLWEYALLECDFDLYGLFMFMAANNDGKPVSQEIFYKFFYQLCDERLNWLKEKFPSKTSRTYIQRCITWMFDNKGKFLEHPFILSDTSKNRHFLQRKKWSKIWGHLDKDERVTNEGQRFVDCIPFRSESLPSFWLAPSKRCAVKMRVFADGEIPSHLFSPAWNLLRPRNSPSPHDEKFVDAIADHMKGAFDVIRMAHFKQAPLTAIIPYIYFLERESNKRIEEHALFRAVFEKYRGQLSCQLHSDLSRCHYKKNSI